MIERLNQGITIAIAVALGGGCRGETTAPSAPPQTDTAAHPKETLVTTPPKNPEPGPPLTADTVVPHFQRWWKQWSSEHLAAHLQKATLDERVAAGAAAKLEACAVLAAHVEERAPVGSPELLFGDPATLRGRGDRCWWLHHDGLMGPGLGSVLASDGTVLVVWVVREG